MGKYLADVFHKLFFSLQLFFLMFFCFPHWNCDYRLSTAFQSAIGNVFKLLDVEAQSSLKSLKCETLQTNWFFILRYWDYWSWMVTSMAEFILAPALW